MSLYPLGIARRQDVALAAQDAVVGQVAVCWVLADELAGAVLDPRQGPPQPLEHAAALEAIHRRMCVLPIRFGTVLSGEAEFRSLLEAGRRELLDRLDRLDGTCEMGLRIALPECPAMRPDPSPAISPSVSYLHQRRAHYEGLDSLVAQADLTVERFVRELHGTYREWRRLTPSPPGLTYPSPHSVPLLDVRQAVMRDSPPHCFCEAVAHCDPTRGVGEKCGPVRLAFLVERNRIAAFQQRCQASRRERPGEQQTVLGPWPPYSFV
jgi:hypothetical protein